MKVAIYCHSIAPSIDGVCRRFTGMMAELISQGHEVILFTLEEKPDELPAGLKDVVILPHMCFPAYPEKKVARPNLSTLWRIWKNLKKHRPDVVHVTCDGITQMFSFVGILTGIPVVGSFHTDIIDLITTHDANQFQVWCVNTKEWLDSVVLNSAATTSYSFQEKLSKRGIKTEYILKTAVDTTMFHPSKRSKELRKELTFGDPEGFLCVYVGRISNEKRIHIIREAIEPLEHVYLALIGDGPTAPVWAKLHSKKNKIYCKPKFLSHSDLAQVYASSDVHVSASEFETLGNTVLEAFASNIPVVVPYTQGFRDTVTTQDKKVSASDFSNYSDTDSVENRSLRTEMKYHDGYWFEPGDAESARHYIEMIKDDPHLRKKLGDNGRRNVAALTCRNVVLEMLEWYGQGKRNIRSRNLLTSLCLLIPLLMAIPFCIVSLFCYDMVTMVMVKVLGMKLDLGANDEKIKSKNVKAE